MGRAGLLQVLLLVEKGFTLMGDVSGVVACRRLSCRGGTKWQEELMLCVDGM